jgi:hypothetical protein
MRNMSQMLRRCGDCSPCCEQEKAPKIGAFRRKYNFNQRDQAKEALAQTLDLRAQSPK